MLAFSGRCKGLLALFLVAGASCLLAQVPSVTTAEYDNGRTTANNSEFILNPFNLNVNQFGKWVLTASMGRSLGSRYTCRA